MMIAADRFLLFGIHVDRDKLYSYFKEYPVKHPDEFEAEFLQRHPDFDKIQITATLLQERTGLPKVGFHRVYIGEDVVPILGFGSNRQELKILTEVLDEICGELGVKRSDADWYVPLLSEEEWD